MRRLVCAFASGTYQIVANLMPRLKFKFASQSASPGSQMVNTSCAGSGSPTHGLFHQCHQVALPKWCKVRSLEYCLYPFHPAKDSTIQDQLYFCLFDLILYVPSTIFQLYRDGSPWVEPVLSQDMINCTLYCKGVEGSAESC